MKKLFSNILDSIIIIIGGISVVYLFVRLFISGLNNYFENFIIPIIIIITATTIYLLVQLALKNKEGYIFKVLDFIYGAFLLFLACMSLYIIAQGLSYLYKENVTLFIIVVCTAIFSIYYWYKKKHSL
jgi:hypothetical protein